MEYAKVQLDRIPKDPDGVQELVNSQILEIIEVFSKQGHSGSSANYVLTILERLLRHKPFLALTGADDEWHDPVGDGLLSNIHCPSVYKLPSGEIFDMDAVCVTDNGGITHFVSNKFCKPVTFPYIPPIHPEVIYIEYTEDVPPGFTSDNYEVITGQHDRIIALRERMEKKFAEARSERTVGLTTEQEVIEK